jgi:hypothetical protein
MKNQPHSISSSGVRISNDFRENLIIDRYDPVFTSMRASKLKHLRSENSEDALTWNVFRSLRQIQPGIWLPTLAEAGLPGLSLLPTDSVTINLWQGVAPPLGLLADGDEGISEIDVIIESPHWVWFIEAKYRSDISTGTTTRPTRDQVIRNIDVGSYYAGVRDFFFSLLIQSEKHSPFGVEAIRRYSNLTSLKSSLAAHRPDGLSNLKAITCLAWTDLGCVLESAREKAHRLDERGYAERALNWMENKGLLRHAG